MAFDGLFPKSGGSTPAQAPGGASAPAAIPGGPGGGLPGGAPGATPPSAQAIIDQFVAYAKSEGIPEEEVVEMIMEAIIAAGYQPPPEDQVAKLVSASYKGSPEGGPAPAGGLQGGAPTAPQASGPPGGGTVLPLQ